MADSVRRGALARTEMVFIGGGNMGAALLGGLLAAGRPAETMAVVELAAERRQWLTREFPGVQVAAEIPPCESAVLAVKPPQITEVAVAAARAGATRVLSIAAGISTARIDAALEAALEDGPGAGSSPVAVIRAMPNTPALVGRAVSAIVGGRRAAESDLVWAEQILGGVGLCLRIDEDHFDAVTAITGSGPAYVFRFAEALVAVAEECGFDATTTDAMVRQLLLGSAELLAERGDPAGLRAMVTSPGGTTAAGLAALEEQGFPAAIRAAVLAAAQRSKELG